MCCSIRNSGTEVMSWIKLDACYSESSVFLFVYVKICFIFSTQLHKVAGDVSPYLVTVNKSCTQDIGELLGNQSF